MSTIIAFTGLAGSGKSTAAAYLAENGFQRVRFAGPLKAMMRAMYSASGINAAEIDRRIEGDLKEQPDPVLGGRTPRLAMQTLGTEWGRECIGEDFWVSLIAQRLAKGGDFVIEDCRFPNEADVVRGLGGIVVQIDCPWAGSASGGGHASEKMAIQPDYVVQNDVKGDMERLYWRVDIVLDHALAVA